MKNRSRYALQYLGYPLTVADKKQEKIPSPVLDLAASQNNNRTTFIQHNTITNDPRHWDVNWFGCYE